MEELVHLRLFGVCQEFAGLIEGVYLVPLAQRLQVAEFLESIVEYQNESAILKSSFFRYLACFLVDLGVAVDD